MSETKQTKEGWGGWIGPIKPENIVYALAIYKWEAQLSIVAMYEMFERLVPLLGRPPDHAMVWPEGTWNAKDLRYRNFRKRDLIHQGDWVSLAYDWRRQPEWRLYLAAGIRVKLETNSSLTIEIDESMSPNVAEAYDTIIEIVCETLRPLYGIGFAVPYSWEPHKIMIGEGFGAPRQIEVGLKHNSREAFGLRAENAGRILFDERHVLAHKVLDIFAINLISAKHLQTLIDGISLRDWIEQGGHGSLKQLNAATWRWDVPLNLQSKVRRAAAANGLIVDPFWDDLGWIDP